MRLWMNWGLMTIAASALVCVPLAAHHSFVMFDTAKQVSLEGVVTEFQWTNPHAYIEVDVAADGKHWSVELGSPSILQQSGWKFSTLKKGDKVTLAISPLKNGDPGGLLVFATLADGRTLGNGPGRGPATPTKGGPAKGNAK